MLVLVDVVVVNMVTVLVLVLVLVDVVVVNVVTVVVLVVVAVVVVVLVHLGPVTTYALSTSVL